MADLGANPLWSDMAGGADTVETDLLGPDYSYADNIQGPSSLGVGSNGSFGQLFSNAGAIAYYVEALITGNPALGNQYFVNTGGTCTAPDGTLKSRYNYINNMSSGAASLPPAIAEIGSDFNGLLPGVVDDIEGLNPLYLFKGLTSDASPACPCYQCPVTAGFPYQYLTPELSPDLASGNCTIVDSSFCEVTAKETAAAAAAYAKEGKEPFSNKESFIGAIPTIVAGLGILYFVFSGK
jgi:hypothetical protein